jgi:hypothetical protein
VGQVGRHGGRPCGELTTHVGRVSSWPRLGWRQYGESVLLTAETRSERGARRRGVA